MTEVKITKCPTMPAMGYTGSARVSAKPDLDVESYIENAEKIFSDDPSDHYGGLFVTTEKGKKRY